MADLDVLLYRVVILPGNSEYRCLIRAFYTTILVVKLCIYNVNSTISAVFYLDFLSYGRIAPGGDRKAARSWILKNYAEKQLSGAMKNKMKIVLAVLKEKSCGTKRGA